MNLKIEKAISFVILGVIPTILLVRYFPEYWVQAIAYIITVLASFLLSPIISWTDNNKIHKDKKRKKKNEETGL